VDNARERARRRLVAFFQRDEAPSQETFAETIGYSQSWVSKILTRGPKLEDLDAISAAMGLSTTELVSSRDLIRHEARPDSADVGSPDPRDLELAERLESALGTVSAVVLALRGEAPTARAAETTRPRTRRKTG
jgi:transcriptional regulator with XRE-family HTH domain